MNMSFHLHVQSAAAASTSVPMPDGTNRTVQNIHDLVGIEANYAEKINELWKAAVNVDDKEGRTTAETDLQALRSTLEQLAMQAYDFLQGPIQLMFHRLLNTEASLHAIVNIEKEACALRHEKEQLGPDKMNQIRKEAIGVLLQRARHKISYYNRKIIDEYKHEQHVDIAQIRDYIKENY